MNIANKAIVLACILLYILYLTQPKWNENIEGFRTKCFSCEAQDHAMGIDRDYGSKCFSCEAQSNDWITTRL